MSSMRNAVQRRNHKERAQPLERSKWGLLEKHKDYSLRAQDHNKKKRRLKALQEKATERNEDEFYFGMMSSSTKGGIKSAKRSEAQGGGRTIDMDEAKLLKTQDAAYLRTVLNATKKEIERLHQEVTLLKQGISTESSGPGKVTFDEDGNAIRRPQQISAAHTEDLLSDSDGSDEASPAGDTASPRERQIGKMDSRLTVLRDRQRRLTGTLLAVEDQRVRMNGGPGRSSKGTKITVKGRKR